MSMPLTMAGHERTYRAPRSLREHIGADVTAWDLFTLESDERAGAWAHSTLTALVASVEAETADVLGCTDCLDTGFYGESDPDNPDLLVRLIRRVGDDRHEALTADGRWVDAMVHRAGEVLDPETAADLGSAIVAGASGLLRLYGQPRAFLPPADTAPLGQPLSALVSAAEPGTPQTFAVVHGIDQGAVLDVVTLTAAGRLQVLDGADWQDLGETPDVLAVPLVGDQLQDVMRQMAPMNTDALVADTPPTMSPDPRAAKLRRYWSHGRGAAKIRWNTPSDWKRCYRHLRKYMGLRARGYCANLHRVNTGVWPGSRFNVGGNGRRGHLLSAGNRQAAVYASPGHVLCVGDRLKVLGPEAVPYAAQVVDLPTLRDLLDPQLVGQSMHVLHAAGSVDGEGAVAVLLDRAGPEPVSAESGSPALADHTEVEQPLFNGAAVSSQHSPPRVGALLAPSVEEVLGAQPALPNVVVAAVRTALRNHASRSHGAAPERVAVLLPPAVVRLAPAASDDWPAGAVVYQAPMHSYDNTPWTTPETALLAALRSGRISGATEGKTTMPDTLTDGVYTEIDSGNLGLVQALTAGGIPVAAPDEWFENPKLDKPTTVTCTDDGRVYGHLAPWGVTHIGMAGDIPVPHNRAGTYAYFRTGQHVTASGKSVRVGQLTLSGGHASTEPGTNVASVIKHYDDTRSAVADVAAGEDEHGIWVAGALRPGVTPEQIRVMRASPPSGDWRRINGEMELVAACHVNVQGYPIAACGYAGGAVEALVAAGARQMAELALSQRADAALVERMDRLDQLVASLATAEVKPAEVGEVEVLDAEVGEVEVVEPAAAETVTEAPSEEDLSRADLIAKTRDDIAAAKRQALRDRVAKATAGSGAPPTAAERKDKSTIKGTDSFPIGNVGDLKKAIQAVGRAKNPDAARKHIISQAYKLKRPDLIPAGWRSSK